MFLTEIIQFKKLLESHEIYDSNDIINHQTSKISIGSFSNINNNALVTNEIILPSEIPISSIVNSNIANNSDNLYYSIAEKLFLKYVIVGSEFEINISSQERLKVTQFFSQNNKNNYGLYEIFDVCINQIWFLMRDSFSRFLLSKEYKRNKMLFDKKKKSVLG